jgi:hypothetical protein
MTSYMPPNVTRPTQQRGSSGAFSPSLVRGLLRMLGQEPDQRQYQEETPSR